ncbi:MAG: hypothetical protein AAB740_01655, partial [Patescibacteria group bacterium]
ITFFSGVPCSIFNPVLNNIPSDVVYINAPREDIALGMASGACLGGVKSAILIQNSGLGNIINGLTSFNLIYEVPVLLIITWRGYDGKDSPEHLIMGETTPDFLKIMGISYKLISDDFFQQVRWARKEMASKKIPVALLLKEGII